jgi:hypothetical protein
MRFYFYDLQAKKGRYLSLALCVYYSDFLLAAAIADKSWEEKMMRKLFPLF